MYHALRHCKTKASRKQGTASRTISIIWTFSFQATYELVAFRIQAKTPSNIKCTLLYWHSTCCCHYNPRRANIWQEKLLGPLISSPRLGDRSGVQKGWNAALDTLNVYCATYRFNLERQRTGICSVAAMTVNKCQMSLSQQMRRVGVKVHKSVPSTKFRNI